MKFIAMVLVTLWVSGCAVSTPTGPSALTASDREMADHFMQTAQAFVQSAVGGAGNVQVFIEDDVATLIGYVDSRVTRAKAERAALRDERVNSVNNRIIAN